MKNFLNLIIAKENEEVAIPEEGEIPTPEGEQSAAAADAQASEEGDKQNELDEANEEVQGEVQEDLEQEVEASGGEENQEVDAPVDEGTPSTEDSQVPAEDDPVDEETDEVLDESDDQAEQVQQETAEVSKAMVTLERMTQLVDNAKAKYLSREGYEILNVASEHAAALAGQSLTSPKIAGATESLALALEARGKIAMWMGRMIDKLVEILSNVMQWIFSNTGRMRSALKAALGKASQWTDGNVLVEFTPRMVSATLKGRTDPADVIAAGKRGAEVLSKTSGILVGMSKDLGEKSITAEMGSSWFQSFNSLAGGDELVLDGVFGVNFFVETATDQKLHFIVRSNNKVEKGSNYSFGDIKAITAQAMDVLDQLDKSRNDLKTTISLLKQASRGDFEKKAQDLPSGEISNRAIIVRAAIIAVKQALYSGSMRYASSVLRITRAYIKARSL